MSYLALTAETIENEHICCAFSDKKCAASYQQKKRWLTTQFDPPDARPVFFNDAVRGGRCPVQDGLVAYYSNRCPSLRGIPRDGLPAGSCGEAWLAAHRDQA